MRLTQQASQPVATPALPVQGAPVLPELTLKPAAAAPAAKP